MRSSLYKGAAILSLALIDGSIARANSVSDGAKSVFDPSSGVPQNLFGKNSAFQAIADTLIFVVGAVAVVALIIGGFRYVISQGDATQVKQAKDTILYAIIGIIVAVLAYSVVSFVAGAIK